MNDAKLLGKGISFPPRIGPDGRIAWSEGAANVRESIRVILMTELNERLMLPGFGGGLGRFLFEPNVAATHHLIQERIQKALARWEPRIRLESVFVEGDPQDPEAAVVTVTYRLVATDAIERVSLSVTLSNR